VSFFCPALRWPILRVFDCFCEHIHALFVEVQSQVQERVVSLIVSHVPIRDGYLPRALHNGGRSNIVG